jgi:ABC-type nitrate/sulfonate/bicarbonate transport system permease component
MFDLKTAITIVEIIVGIAVALIIGDYLGYKFGRWKLASYSLFTMLGIIVAFAIFAAIWLNTRG